MVFFVAESIAASVHHFVYLAIRARFFPFFTPTPFLYMCILPFRYELYGRFPGWFCGADEAFGSDEGTTMKRNIAITTLALAIVLGSASVTMAAKKHMDPRQAYGSAAGNTVVDPRDAYWAKRKGGGDTTWCDADPQCNGWGEWLQGVNSGRLKSE
jgi:hypothetical protein